jgi:tryptophan halogenase
MQFGTEVSRAALAGEARVAEQTRREAAVQTQRMRAGLPRHRDLIRRIVEHGMPAI